MKLDIVTIFPSFFDVLELGLIGRANRLGILEVRALDLRDFSHDIHKTVDDTPYGGGAGMVMKPEPLGEAIDAVVAGSKPVIIFTTPAGELFTQQIAQELSTKDHLVFACGRYEGIDQRVVEHFGKDFDVRELSIGDYVLNGGEVASVAMIEAIVRLLPGVVGNAESLEEESFSEGLLEYPSYTKPQSWRGLEVPETLLSGHHAEIAKWRKEQSKRRTEKNRPDLLK